MKKIPALKLSRFFLNGRLPSYIVFFVTSKCNSNCKVCFYWRNIQKEEKEDELKLDEIEKISMSLGRISILSLSGGEPFIRDDLSEICRIFYTNNKPLFLDIPTNGLMPKKILETTNRILLNCKNLILEIELSLDGLYDKHDEIRGVKGNFTSLLETYGYLKKLQNKFENLKIKINTTFSYFNQNDIPDILKFIHEKLKIDRFNVSMVHGEPRDKRAHDIEILKFMKVDDLIRRRWFGIERKDFYFIVLAALKNASRKTIIRTLSEKHSIYKCRAIRRIIVIDEKGNVFPCETLRESLGNLRDQNYNLKKILFSQNRKNFEEKYIKKGQCFCPWGCAVLTNLIYDVRAYPAILKCLLDVLVKL